MHASRLIPIGVPALMSGVLACASPAGPSLADLQQAQAQWASHHLTRYAYRYETDGFLIAYQGQTLRLVVINDTVRSAQFVATNDSVPVDPGTLPTIDGLFANAATALQEGRLTDAQFDPSFGFPSRLAIAGPPDASGVITASDIELLP